MKVNEVTLEYLIGYLRLDDPETSVVEEVNTALSSAMSYVKGFTGLTETQLEEHEDITSALVVLVADFFENKSYYLDYKNKETNKMVEGILSMHSVNLV